MSIGSTCRKKDGGYRVSPRELPRASADLSWTIPGDHGVDQTRAGGEDPGGGKRKEEGQRG